MKRVELAILRVFYAAWSLWRGGSLFSFSWVLYKSDGFAGVINGVKSGFYALSGHFANPLDLREMNEAWK